MSAVSKIQSVLKTNLLMPELLHVPARGATDDELRREEDLLGRPFCADLVALLRTWNGLNLEVIRIFGCNATNERVARFSQYQNLVGERGEDEIAIGSDHSGFIYLQARDGRILTLDTDGGGIEHTAADLDDLIERVIFGPDAATFAGPDWLAELHTAGIVA